MSPEGSRKVVVSGEEKFAFLYDLRSPASFDPAYLGRDVLDVQFQLGELGQLARIVTVMDDGAYNVWDPYGHALGQVVYSPDMTRKVDISGADKAAYLYDNTASPLFDPVYLASDVRAVQYQRDQLERMVIIALVGDGRAYVFNAFGHVIEILPAPAPPTMSSQGASGAQTPADFGSRAEKSRSLKALRTGELGW